MSNTTIAKEVAFCLCTDAADRMKEERYMVAQNAIPIRDWSNIAVVLTTPNLDSLSNIICIDYSEYFSKEFRQREELFMKIILMELKVLSR